MPRTPRDLADQMAARRRRAGTDDGYVRETFSQPRDEARKTARAFLDRWPAAAYMSKVDTRRELPGEEIEFTMKRLKSADKSSASRGHPPSHTSRIGSGN